MNWLKKPFTWGEGIARAMLTLSGATITLGFVGGGPTFQGRWVRSTHHAKEHDDVQWKRRSLLRREQRQGQ